MYATILQKEYDALQAHITAGDHDDYDADTRTWRLYSNAKKDKKLGIHERGQMRVCWTEVCLRDVRVHVSDARLRADECW
jgi:hypothetical protein